jgi:hypothetical protein
MPREPIETPHSPAPFQESRMLAAVTNTMAREMREPMASRKNKAAINAVAAPSKFNSREAVAAGVAFSPHNRAIGAAIPPAVSAPINQGMSERSMRASFFISGLPVALLWISSRTPMPTPVPRYRKAAMGSESTLPNINLDSGVLKPNNTAARIAAP